MIPTFQFDDYDGANDQSYLGKAVSIQPNTQTNVYEMNAMRAGGWVPTNGLPKEDSTLPYNMTLHKASVGPPTVNTALYNQFPQQPWDIDPNALCTVETDNSHVSGSAALSSSSAAMSGKKVKMMQDRASRSGWNLLTPSNQEQKVPSDIQARHDGVTQMTEGRLQDRRLISQNVSRSSPLEGFGYGSSAVPLAYQNLNFPTTDPPVGLDNCESNEGYSFMDSDNLGFHQSTNQNPKWNQHDMGGMADDTSQIFPYQGNTRYLMSHKDPVSGKTYMVFGRDPLLENTGKVYDEVPSRQLGRANRRLEEMMGNRRLTSPMPNKSDVPNQVVIPDKQGLARGQYEAARRMDEQRFAKTNFFNRDNDVRPPPPEAARTQTGTPYTGFVGIREMARYNNVNEPSMKEPEFAARKYDVHVAPQTHVSIRSDTIPETKQSFFVAGLGSSSVGNTIDPVGTNVLYTAKPTDFHMLPSTEIEAGQFINDNNRLVSKSTNVHGNNYNQMNGMGYTPENYFVSGAAPIQGKFVAASTLSAMGNAANMTDNALMTDNSFMESRAMTSSSAPVSSGSAMQGTQIYERNQEQNYDVNTYNSMQTNIAAMPGQMTMIHDPLLNDSSNALNTSNNMANLGWHASAQNFAQLPSLDDFTPKDDLNSVTRLAYLGNTNQIGNGIAQLNDMQNMYVMPDALNNTSYLQTNMKTRPADFMQMRQFEDDKDFMNTNTFMSTNISISTSNSQFLPDRDYENINSEVQMNIDHSFLPTFGHGGMNTANQVPKLTDNGQVDNDRVIPYDWLAGSRRVQENLEYKKEYTLPANFRDIPEKDKEPYLIGLRVFQETEAAKYKNAEESTRTLRRIVSDSQKTMFDAYNEKRRQRKLNQNPESDTDTDCDVSK